MPAYKVAMALGAAGAAWWWWSTSKHQETLQGELGRRAGGSVRVVCCTESC